MYSHVKFAVVLLFIVFFVSNTFAGSIPRPSDPWAAPASSNPSPDPLTPLLQALRRLNASDDNYYSAINRIRAGLKDLAEHGDIRAQLVYFGITNRGIADDQIIGTFETIDRLDDPRTIYEIAKLMQLRYSLCVNMVIQNDVKRIDRFCSVSFDEAATRAVQDAFRSRYIGYFLKSASSGYSPSQFELGLIMLREPSELPSNQRNESKTLGGRTAMEWINAAAASEPEANLFLSKINEEENARKMNEQKEKARADEQRKFKPTCEFIRFTGIASAGWTGLIENALHSSDIEDTLARNPISCNRMGCNGVAYFQKHRGRIVGWDKDYFRVVSPVDFNSGRRDIFLSIRRIDAICQK